MPVNVSAFLGNRQHTNCACYKCRVKRELDGFALYMATVPAMFGGFLPRNYDARLNYNTMHQHMRRGGLFGEIDEGEVAQDSPPVVLTLEKVESIKSVIKSITNYNRDKITTIPRTAIARNKNSYCVDCGKLHKVIPHRSIVYQNQTRTLCATCFRAKYNVCMECNAVKHTRDCTVHDGRMYCSACFAERYYRCNRCDNIYNVGTENQITLNLSNGLSRTNTLCPSCFSSLYVCASCGNHFFDSARNVGDRRGMCSQCFSDQHQIKQYNYKPAARFKIDSKLEKVQEHSLLTGFEWELENHSGGSCPKRSHETHADIFSSIMPDGMLYFKRDGSLNNGFEVVTHPFSWEFYKSHKEPLKVLIKTAYENGLRADTTCGIHIHMSKKAFGYAQLYKFVKFIYSPENRSFIVDLSQRGGENSFASFRGTDTMGMAKFAKTKRNASSERHSAVNATGASTIEVRFFASTTNFIAFCKNIEFVYALYEYTTDTSMRDQKVPLFLAWLAQRHVANKYRNLAVWIRDANINSELRRVFRKNLKKNGANLNLEKGE